VLRRFGRISSSLPEISKRAKSKLAKRLNSFSNRTLQCPTQVARPSRLHLASTPYLFSSPTIDTSAVSSVRTTTRRFEHSSLYCSLESWMRVIPDALSSLRKRGSGQSPHSLSSNCYVSTRPTCASVAAAPSARFLRTLRRYSRFLWTLAALCRPQQKHNSLCPCWL
jgi:hypothetical protein